jgi:HPt (histidine-containing phosphotransfer) domain-containing protein
LDDAARRLDEIDRALAAGDDPAVGMAAHALKGSCAYLGAVRLGELCRSLEERANAADLSEGAATAAGIRDEFATVAALLAEELEKS